MRQYVKPIKCLVFIKGSDDGDEGYAKFFARDMVLADKIACTGQIVEFDALYRKFYTKNDKELCLTTQNELLLRVCLHCDKANVMATVKRLMNAHSVGEIIMMYSGHGFADGSWFLKGSEDSEGFSYNDLAGCLPCTNHKASVQTTLFLNCCYSHLWVEWDNVQKNPLSRQGVRIVPTTNESNHFCPPGGIIELLNPPSPDLEQPLTDVIKWFLVLVTSRLMIYLPLKMWKSALRLGLD